MKSTMNRDILNCIQVTSIALSQIKNKSIAYCHSNINNTCLEKTIRCWIDMDTCQIKFNASECHILQLRRGDKGLGGKIEFEHVESGNVMTLISTVKEDTYHFA